MPTYEYRCDACGHEFELFQQMSAPTKRKCPECGKNRLKRLIGTGAGIIFKGGGFYETDYRSDSYRKDAEADKKADSGSSKKSDAKQPAKESTKEAAKKPAKPEAKQASKPGKTGASDAS